MVRKQYKVISKNVKLFKTFDVHSSRANYYVDNYFRKTHRFIFIDLSSTFDKNVSIVYILK